MNEELRREVEHWLRFAREDLQEARRLVTLEGVVPRHPAWLAQQAAEKALKAVLIYLQISFPRTHNLEALRSLIPGGWHVGEVNVDLASLSEYAVESRYPGDLADIGLDEAEVAVADAARLVEAAQNDLRPRMKD